jgi:hypothetical protein
VKVIIAGGRNILDPMLVEMATERFVREYGPITEVVCGGARGVDWLGERWARRNRKPVKHFPADWKHMGRRAGPYRNEQMAKYADALILIWDGESRGSGHMLREAHGLGLKVLESKIRVMKQTMRGDG